MVSHVLCFQNDENILPAGTAKLYGVLCCCFYCYFYGVRIYLYKFLRVFVVRKGLDMA